MPEERQDSTLIDEAMNNAEGLPNDGDTVELTEDLVEEDMHDLYDQMQKLTDERDQLQNQVLRALADFQNMKKRHQQEIALIRQFATEEFVKALIPVIDNFERTVAHAKAGGTAESLAEGVQAVERQLKAALESQKVIRVESVGHPFDPEVHEALGTDETDAMPEDHVTFEIEAAYKMGNKVIRPARVRVAKKGS